MPQNLTHEDESNDNFRDIDSCSGFSQTFIHSFRTSEVYCLGSIFLINPYLNEYIVATFITLHYFDDFKRK